MIVDPGRGLAYLMNPAGGIDAVELSCGQVAWTTREGAKPLALVGDRLAAQTEPAAPAGELKVVVLDVARKGQAVVSGDFDLPPGVRAAVDETLESVFTAEARPLAGDAVISWTYHERLPRGMVEVDPLAREGQGLHAIEAAAGASSSGTLRLDLTTGAIAAASAEVAAAAAPAPRGPDLAPEQALPGVAGTQFVSADGRHVLASERVNDERVTEPYRWTIYERASGERQGQIRSLVSWTPFFVSGNRLIHESPTYLESREGAITESPLQLRAVDLGTGKVLWTRPVRDTAYRGPFPP